MKTVVKRHSPVVVVLHWSLAVMILLAIYMGGELAKLPDDVEIKVNQLVAHTAVGITIGLLFTVRLFLRFRSPRNQASGTQSFPHGAAAVGHWLIYLLVFVVVFTGVGITFQIDLLAIIRNHEVLPYWMSTLPVHTAHMASTKLLITAVTIHVLAALYHQLILRDRLWSKMGLGKGSS